MMRSVVEGSIGGVTNWELWTHRPSFRAGRLGIEPNRLMKKSALIHSSEKKVLHLETSRAQTSACALSGTHAQEIPPTVEPFGEFFIGLLSCSNRLFRAPEGGVMRSRYARSGVQQHHRLRTSRRCASI